MCMNIENSNAYRYLSVVYDKMTGDVSFEDWGEYLTSFFDKPRPSVLEYACGTGNVTEQLVKLASSVTAVDISAEMLTQAQEKFRRSGRDINFVECDMTAFILNKPVDYAVCACDGVNYIISDEDLNRFIGNVFTNLKPDGLFLFDISSHYKLKSVLGDEFFYIDGDDATLFWQNTYDDVKSLTEMDLTLFLKSQDVYHRYDELHTQRSWHTDEIRHCLLKNGFNDVRIFKFGTREQPYEKDERIQFVAQK